MGINNPLQFAITREDPELEIGLVRRFDVSDVLAVCSAGDTVLALKHAFPSLRISTFDFNPVQLEHLKTKATCERHVLNHEPYGQCQKGNFESLFRQWRLFFNEFVLNDSDTRAIFFGAPLVDFFQNKYWPVSFELHFHDSFLRAMFGDAAVQHAPKGSYPRYFQDAFERGLRSPDFRANPFLQHLFLGEYLEVPSFLRKKNDLKDVELIKGTLGDVPGLDRFGLVQLSNIFDWSNEEEIRGTCELLKNNMAPGALVLIRQINNDSPMAEFLGPCFKVHEDISTELLARDRSLFYSRIVLAQKRSDV